MFYQFCHSILILIFLTSIEAFESQNRFPKRDICFQQGTQCSEDCSVVFFCSGTGASPTIVSNCAAVNQACYSNSSTVAGCSSTESDCKAPGGTIFHCQGDGDFPDPYNCRKGYTCGNGASTPVEECVCPPGSMWNSPYDCSRDEDNVQFCCRDFELDCETAFAGNFGPNCTLTHNGYYYVCDRSSGDLKVLVSRCRSGTYFDETTYSCRSLFYESEVSEEEFASEGSSSVRSENVVRERGFCTQSKSAKNIIG